MELLGASLYICHGFASEVLDIVVIFFTMLYSYVWVQVYVKLGGCVGFRFLGAFLNPEREETDFVSVEA